MSDVIVDLAARRRSASSSRPLEHPAGVTLAFNRPSDAALITPEIRTGANSADLVRLVPDTVGAGDRVLVIGAGLGVVSTLVARVERVGRIIAAEPNPALFPYLEQVHESDGVTGVETINAVLAVGKKGKIPFCTQQDPRTSLLMPHNRSRQQAMMVQLMDLNVILTDERINVIICDTPAVPAQLLAQAELGQVDRILLHYGGDLAHCWDGDGVCTRLVARGYFPETSGTAILLRRSSVRRSGSTRVATQANLNSAPGLTNLG